MTAIDFPNSPTVDDLFTVGDRTWKWTGSVWITVEEAVVGPAGVVASDSEPTSTDVLWLDTDEEPDVPVPAGGTDGQVLTKTSSADYATAWENIPEGTTVISSDTAPEDTGAIWYDTENGNAYIYYDGFWTSISGPGIPVGGTTGQILAKSSNTDYATEWVAPSALTLIKTQTIGTAVTSVEVTDAFSADYENYLIMINGGVGSADNRFNLQLGSTTTGYFSVRDILVYANATRFTTANNNGANFPDTGSYSSNNIAMELRLQNPFQSKVTMFQTTTLQTTSGGAMFTNGGMLNNTTSYTAFTLICASGNVTGGTISVYGYEKA